MKRRHHLVARLLAVLFTAGSLLGGLAGLLATAVAAPIVPLNDTCFVSVNNSGITDYSSADASALQTAVDNATPGTRLKIAGTCRGTQTRHNLTQTVYISQNLTLQGGYTTTKWLSPPDSTTYPTILDANGDGRVTYISTTYHVILDHLTLTKGNAIQGEDNNAGGGAILVDNSATVTVTNSTLTNNYARLGGAAMSNSSTIVIHNSTLISNSAVYGGALFNLFNSQLTIEDTQILSNTADVSGAIQMNSTTAVLSNSRVAYNQARQTGAINQGDGAMTIQKSVIHHNIATDTIGAINSSNTTFNIINSTISNNTAGGDTGAIYMRGIFGLITITHSTIAHNTASAVNGLYLDNSSVFITNSILDNGTENCFLLESTDTFGGTPPGNMLTSGGYSLSSDTSCPLTNTTDITNTNPLLLPLANNGQSATDPASWTHALQPGSPAINAIPAGLNGCGTTFNSDQRGVSRPLGPGCDLGAHENNAPSAVDNMYDIEQTMTLLIDEPGILNNDTDPFASGLTAVLVTPPQQGILNLNRNGAFTYTPTISITNLVTFSYQAITPASIIAHWPFEDSNNPTANVVGQNHAGTLTNGAKFTTTVPLTITTLNNYAITLNGSDQYVTIPDHPDLNFANNEDFTVALWVKADPLQTDTTHPDNDILIKWNTSGGYPFALRYLNQTSDPTLRGRIRAIRYDGTNFPYIDSSVRIDDGHYHHVAFTKLGPDLSLYIDGLLVGTTTDTISGNTTNNSPLYIGRRGPSRNYFRGQVDDVHIFRTSLSPTEIAALAEGTPGYTRSNTALVAINVYPPAVTPTLTISHTGGTTATLAWDTHPNNCNYGIFKSADPFSDYQRIASGNFPGGIYADNGAIGNPAENYFYYVTTSTCVEGAPTVQSSKVGEFDFALVPGN
ncbi:MAG TPA: LamG-like jellyroll fold domain-containing protein [Anaerolineae bacterium]|nr:LamG-like jellyroll fold domain-containing protein [Anaerolineae bacterium]